ncbi:hypothetical protein ACFV42_46420 [Streptomyces solisilvae]|uniref:hypothetical protein n=1 Tax=Streptomyces malaysiensis TaxID=92644 RepID=UPI0036BAE2D2
MSIPGIDIERETLEARIQHRTGAAAFAEVVESVLSGVDEALTKLAAGDRPSYGDVAAFRGSAAKLVGVLRARAENEEAGV